MMEHDHAVLNQRQVDILLHMTGLDRSDNQSRNHFAADECSSDWEILQSLVARGLVHPGVKGGDVFGGLVFFHVTEDGMAVARAAKEATTGDRA